MKKLSSKFFADKYNLEIPNYRLLYRFDARLLYGFSRQWGSTPYNRYVSLSAILSYSSKKAGSLMPTPQVAGPLSRGKLGYLIVLVSSALVAISFFALPYYNSSSYSSNNQGTTSATLFQIVQQRLKICKTFARDSKGLGNFFFRGLPGLATTYNR